MWLIEYAYRLLTDKRVRCQKCRGQIGYVARKGHATWLCEQCGEGRVTPV